MCVCVRVFLNELCNLPDMTSAAAADCAAPVTVVVAPSSPAPSAASALNPTSMPPPDGTPPASCVAATVAADVAADISLICCVGVAEDSRVASGAMEAMGTLLSMAAADMGVGVAVTLVVSKTSFC